MKPADKKRMQFRTIVVGVIFCLFFAAIGAKAVHVQVFRGSWLSKKAADQYLTSFVSRGRRGTIYDTNHREMAVTIDVTSIGAHPVQIKDPGLSAKYLARALRIDKRKLYPKLASKKSFVWIKRQVNPKQAKIAKNLEIKGTVFKTERSRFYPNRSLAAQILGFSGIDGHGLEGIEFNYDTYLEGEVGKLTILKDALGRVFDADQNSAQSYNGKNIILTIDRAIQHLTETALEEASKKFSAQSGMAIVMSPKTGAILALANYPRFNPNSFLDFDKKIWRNRVITDPFEPGSTMKLFTAAAAIESGFCSPSTIFFCENGKYRIGRNIVHDTHPRGWLSLQQIVKYSSNIGAVKVSEMIGPEALYKTLRTFGFGEKTGIDCPGETSGSLAHYRRWSKIDTGAISFGQGISVSAIQLVTAASAIANDGILMKPFIVQAITEQNGRLIKKFGPRRVRRAISKRTARTLRRIMRTVITKGGTGVNAALEGYSVCGKTGTAQKIDDSGAYAKGKYMASFIGFAPIENSEAAILVIIDEPKKNYYGGVVAAPVFKKIAHETLNYLNIPPQNETRRFTVSRSIEAKG